LRGKFLTFFVSISRIIIFFFNNMSLIIIISQFFLCCCVFRGAGATGAPCLKELPITRRTHTPLLMFERKRVYLATHVLLLSRVAAFMSVGLVMNGGQSEEARDR